MRAAVWRRSSATTGTATVVLDIDSSLHQIHSENKDETAPNYKGGFGFHPIYCFADATGETLAVLLRPGNAGANTIADHVAVLDQAIAQLPAEIAVGHRDGDDPSAGASPGAGALRLGRVHRLRVALPRSQRRLRRRRPLQRQHSCGDQPHRLRRRRPGSRRSAKTASERPGAAVAELTDLVDLSELAGRDPADRAPRTVAPRRPADPVPLDCCSATGVTTPTPPATPSTSTCTCAPTPTSKTTSAA